MSMHDIQTYVQRLEVLAADLFWFEGSGEGYEKISKALNGELSRTLRDHVPIKTLQQAGAFFTPESMASDLVRPLQSYASEGKVAFDPACGGGNLLIAYAQHLPCLKTYAETLDFWGGLLKGFDLHTEFVRATKARLALLAAWKGGFYGQQAPDIDTLFPHIIVANSLTEEWPKHDVCIMNPPFNSIDVPSWCKWATGTTSLAALFVAKYFNSTLAGSELVAILPDVLRSGSRYRLWRQSVDRAIVDSALKIVGQFDEETSVDVFSLYLRKSDLLVEHRVSWQVLKPQKAVKTLGDFCSINVGRVVPHRDPLEGHSYVYLDVKNTPAWGEIEVSGESSQRKYKGVVFAPPFVAVRRNSRSNDDHRAVATLVKGNRRVAVENHLIVIKPIDGSVVTCRRIIESLRDKRTTDWLNGYIRCRHLTVGALRSTPWWLE